MIKPNYLGGCRTECCENSVQRDNLQISDSHA